MSSETTNLPTEENLDNQDLEDVSLGESADSTQQDKDVEEPAKPKKKGGLGKAILFLLVLLLILGAAAGGWYYAEEQVRLQQGDSSAQVQVVSDQLVGLEGQIANLEGQIGSLQDQLATQSTRQANVEASLQTSSNQTEAQLLSLAQRVSQSETTATGDWELAEAEYLLRIANQHLATSHDVGGALEMMGAADTILKELAYPELTQARRELVSDITRLSNIQPVDYEGIYFALDALLPVISGLSGFRVEELTGSDLVSSDIEGSDESKIDKYWSVIIDALSPYLVINSSSASSGSEYLLSGEQEALAKSEIQLFVRQAQLAMLAGEEEVFKQALSSAGSRISEVFSEDDGAASLISIIRDYSERDISSESVDISRSIRAVEAVVDQLTTRTEQIGQ